MKKYSTKANFKTLGPKYGNLMKEISYAIEHLTDTKVELLLSEKQISIDIEGEKFDILLSEIIISNNL